MIGDKNAISATEQFADRIKKHLPETKIIIEHIVSCFIEITLRFKTDEDEAQFIMSASSGVYDSK